MNVQKAAFESTNSRFGMAALLKRLTGIAAVIMLFSSLTFANSSVQNVIVSPLTVAPGGNVTLTFDYKGTNSGCKTAYFAALSNQCA
ncbi:MAG: hypothetical protein LLG37_10955, partial [Spirochaetia bacterium]|nr:hypothetical protein [Spirochaetia bacterium]